MATANIGDKFPSLTHGGAPNIRACRVPRDSVDLGNVSGDRVAATVSYLVPWAEVCFYFPSYGTPHPECGSRFLLSSVRATRENEDCARLIETYSRETEEGEDPDEPPPTEYSLRSSEFSEPIQLNENFWDVLPGPPIRKGGTWVCNENDAGVLSSWARGFVSDRRDGVVPEGMALWTDGNERNAFPSCHPCFGVESYLESGAEWVVTEYDVGRPNESEISGGGSRLHTISNPIGLAGASAGKWLYTGFTSDFDGQWWSRSRTWRYHRKGWKEEIYAI